MPTVDKICQFLDALAPPELAEQWDNVGLLVGRRDAAVSKLMTCLTVTPDSVAEAVGEQAQLIVTHHPLPFRPLKRLTDDTVPGRLLLQLIAAGIAVYSPHTAFDSATAGINQQLAEGLGLAEIRPLVADEGRELGAGRWGVLPSVHTLGTVAQRLKAFLALEGLRRVGSADQPATRVAVACGSGGSFLQAAVFAGCDLLVTGEATFHSCLEAQAHRVGLLLTGHYASERFAVERLAETLAHEYPELTIWPSRQEADPLDWQ